LLNLYQIEISRVRNIYAGWNHALMIKEDDSLWACGGGGQARGVPVHDYATDTVRLKNAWRLPNHVASDVVSAAAGFDATWYTLRNHTVHFISAMYPPTLPTPMASNYDPAIDENPYRHFRFMEPQEPTMIPAPEVSTSIFNIAPLAFIRVYTGNRNVVVADFSVQPRNVYTFDYVANVSTGRAELAAAYSDAAQKKIVIGGDNAPICAAVMRNGDVVTCGDNSSGQAGQNSISDVAAPAPVIRVPTQVDRVVYTDNPDAQFGGSGFNIKSNGNFMFGNTAGNNMTFTNGALKYRGSIDVKSSLNPGASRMEISDTCIKVFENGVLRVQIGDLSL
jgi:hypothetical protein